ncbi:MAG: DUF1015 family protein [Tissierellaceae bacterium]
MIKIRPFKGYRPRPGIEDKLACKPYDVIDFEEAVDLGSSNPLSFVHIIRGEIDTPMGTDPYSAEVYDRSRENFNSFVDKGYLVEEEKEALYIYRQVRKGRAQNGIVTTISIDDYGEGRIKKHEFTRYEKEIDRIRHFDALDAHTEPVFLFHKGNKELGDLVEGWTESHEALYDFVSEDGVRQLLWLVDDEGTIESIGQIFASMDSLYIADGHHRTESSYKIGLKRRAEKPDYSGQEEFNYFMSVVFPSDELLILPYNRLVKDLNGHTREELMSRLSEDFSISELASLEEPSSSGEIVMALRDKIYRLVAREGSYDLGDRVASLDVSILQNNILSPILGIDDPRGDSRIEFVGGEDMLGLVATRLEEDMELGFLLYPTSIEDIMAISDDKRVMPPKSTWFEPKLMSGLFIHKL